MKYSPSGHMVAVLCGREIVVYSSFTWEVVAVLKGHIGKVASVAWSSNSVHLASAGLDGAVYRWSMDDFKRHEECVTKGSQYSSVIYDSGRTFLYSCGSNLPLRIISTSNKPPPEVLNTFPKDVMLGVYDGEGAWAKHIYRGSIICELHDQPRYLQLIGFFHKRLIFAITDSQALHAYAYPFSNSATTPVMKFPPQPGLIAGLCVDEKHNLVFVRSTKGSILICTLEDGKPSAEGPQSLMTLFNDPHDEDEIVNWLLVKRAELEDSQQEVQDLRSSLQAEQDESRYRQHRIRQDWTAKIKDKEKEFSKKERQLCQEIVMLKEKLEISEKNLEHTTQTLLDSQSQSVGSLYEHFEEKFTGETARAEHWRFQAEKVKEDCVKEIDYKEKVHSSQVLKLQEDIKAIEIQAEAKLQKMQEECNKEIRKYKTYMEEDLLINDEELVGALAQVTQALRLQQKHMDEARSQMLLEKKAATSYQLQISELTSVCTTQETSIRSLETEKSRLENFALEFDYKKRILDKLVEEADEHRKALLHATKERETLAVLQHSKIQQLMQREEPLMVEISQLKAKLQDTLVRESLDVKHRLSQEEAARLLKERILDLEQRLFKLHDQQRQREDFLNAFKEALCVIVQDHDPVEWPPLTRGLFLAYVKGSERSAVAEGLESRAQIMKQRQILEDFVVVLKNTIDRTKERCKEEIQHFVKENLNLLHDFCEANRNVRRMAFMVQKLQQQVAYFKGIVSMQKRSLANARSRSPSRSATPEDKRRSVTSVLPRRASGSFITTGLQRRLRASRESDGLKLGARPPTPVSEILKPWSRFSIIHGDQDHTRRMTTAEIETRMSRPWVAEDEAGRKDSRAVQVEELMKQLNETKAELLKKQEEITLLQSALKASAAQKQRKSKMALGRPGSSFPPRTSPTSKK